MLAFLHTSPLHIRTFGELMNELGPEIPVRHCVDEKLLTRVVEAGTVTAATRAAIRDAVGRIASDGARLIACTCSTIGAEVEAASGVVGVPVMRIDRAMAAAAVGSGRRLVVAAALASTVAPTLALLNEEADRQGSAPEVVTVLCEDAWPCFLRGDEAAYGSEVAERIGPQSLATDVIVLAQASMAVAAPMLQEGGALVLSSPRLGVLAAIAAYRGLDRSIPLFPPA